ncbi:hypothetical protein H839_09338 [Parageobacillus genomosp. 1]|uniref:Uncharacterized protein n=1 Tax=Parageobacillus genomosp. 1 TaxID=1295642 RepID=A0ABC9VEE4_9BACL|nr:hypothetical protein H839_09338 [Parageobacillus genomosp. 1]
MSVIFIQPVYSPSRVVNKFVLIVALIETVCPGFTVTLSGKLNILLKLPKSGAEPFTTETERNFAELDLLVIFTTSATVTILIRDRLILPKSAVDNVEFRPVKTGTVGALGCFAVPPATLIKKNKCSPVENTLPGRVLVTDIFASAA